MKASVCDKQIDASCCKQKCVTIKLGGMEIPAVFSLRGGTSTMLIYRDVPPIWGAFSGFLVTALMGLYFA
jgi:hypothetical protein